MPCQSLMLASQHSLASTLQELQGALESCLWHPLPAGWQSFTVEGTGVPFYVHQGTGAKQWHRPADDDEADSSTTGTSSSKSLHTVAVMPRLDSQHHQHPQQPPLLAQDRQAALARIAEAAAQLDASLQLTRVAALGAEQAAQPALPHFETELCVSHMDAGRSHSWHYTPAAQPMALSGAGARNCVSF